MGVEVREDFQAVGSWRASLTNTPDMLDKLTVKVDEKRVPRKLHWLLYDSAGKLTYIGVLLSVTPGQKGIEIGGQGVLWHLGSNDIGPKVDDREYVAGTDKLDNGSFDLGELHWRRPSQDSLWVLSGGMAGNVGGLAKDDVLEIDRKYPTRPGYGYKAQATDISGVGQFRLRTIYEGRNNPPNLLVNPGFENGQFDWTATPHIGVIAGVGRRASNALRILPIAKPQLISNAGFESGATDWTLGSTMTVGAAGLYAGAQGLICAPNPKPELLTNGNFANGSTGWTLGPTMSVVGGALNCAPNPQPQLIADPSFETGGGWSDVLTPAPMSNDIDIVNDPANAHTGERVLRVGPITQHQVLSNADFGNATTLDHWYSSSTDADPHAVWAADIGGGNNGTNGVRTTGWSTAGRPGPELTKYLRADKVLGGGVDTYAIAPGENYRAEAYFRGHPGTDGKVYISVMIPHPTVPGHDTWWTSKELTSPPNDKNQWVAVTIDNINVPTNRFAINALAEVHGHSLGHWSLDTYTVTRTRGNRARIISNTSYPVAVDTEYRLAMDVRSGGLQSVGSVRLGVILKGAGMKDLEFGTDKGSTDFEWNREVLTVRIPAGYTTATPFVSGQDIIGDPVWVDNITLNRVSHNIDITTHSAFTVVSDQRYSLSAAVSSGAFRGTVTLGVTFTGNGLPNLEREVSQGILPFGTTKTLNVEVRPPDGYTSATVYIRSTDVEGGNFTVDNVSFLKVDNNTDQTVHSTFPILIDQRYLLSAAIRSETTVTNGRVTVGVRVSGAGLPEQSFQESLELTKGEWKGLSKEVRFPSGYTTAQPFVLTKDIEGGPFYVDNVTMEKSDNNSDESVGATLAVTPERTYRWTQQVFSGIGLQRGNIRLRVRCTRTGYADQTFESQAFDATLETWKTIDFSFTPPSGYAVVIPSIVGTDVEGDNFYADDGELRDTDSTTAVFDSTIRDPLWASTEVDSVAPEGSESVRVALIVEQGTTNVMVGGVAFKRTGVTPATGNAIVADVLKSPTTGLPLSIAAGTLSAPLPIPHDWWVLKRTNRQILDHLCNVIYEPPLEYHVAPALPPTLDVGPRATVFADLVNYILLLSDKQVVDIPPAESNVELRPTEIELIGAERQTVSGRTHIISSTAQVPGPVEYDLNNRPIVRTETVTDTTVDHQEYADAYAADLAAKRAEPPLQVTIRLSGTDLTPCKVGDTIYPYYPAAGLEDQNNPREVEGETVFPRGVRILSRLSRKGPSHSAVMRRSDGSTFPLNLEWSNEDSTELTVGDRVEDWTADPGGHAAATQWMRDWKSRPR